MKCKTTELEMLQKVNNALDSYKPIEISEDLLISLQEIAHENIKKPVILKLLPRDFALTAASIMVALYAGIIFSGQIVNEPNDQFAQFEEYYEQISLVSLLD